MEKGNSYNYKQQVGGSSSSMTTDLFGPKDSSKSTTSGLFQSVFGPSSMGLGRGSTHSQVSGSSTTSDCATRRGRGDGTGISSKEMKSSVYQSESVEPCYLSSSIYYGGQDVYPPTTQTNTSRHTFKKDGDEDDQNGNNNSNCASRGNWWQGMNISDQQSPELQQTSEHTSTSLELPLFSLSKLFQLHWAL
nr:RNA-binding protein like [Ipomoea batatas]